MLVIMVDPCDHFEPFAKSALGNLLSSYEIHNCVNLPNNTKCDCREMFTEKILFEPKMFLIWQGCMASLYKSFCTQTKQICRCGHLTCNVLPVICQKQLLKAGGGPIFYLKVWKKSVH